MGRFSKPQNIVALGWTVVVRMAFLLPQFTLADADGNFLWANVNYAPIAVGVVVL